MNINIFTDGGSRGNPGKAAAAVVIKDYDGKIVLQKGSYLGIATNNEAEYHGVILALESIRDLDNLTEIPLLNFHLDSQLVVNQLNGDWKIKESRIYKLTNQVHNLEVEIRRRQPGVKITYNYIPREQNYEADSLVNQTLDNAGI